MHSNERVLVAVFDSIEKADRAIAGLVDGGFSKNTLSVICPQCDDLPTSGVDQVDPAGEHTVESVAVGGAIGSLLGGLTAVGGALATGGVGLAIAGPLLGGAAGWVTGGFLGAMATRGLEPAIADYYDQAVRRGQVLVAVDAPEDGSTFEIEKAERILADAGASPVSIPKE